MPLGSKNSRSRSEAQKEGFGGSIADGHGLLLGLELSRVNILLSSSTDLAMSIAAWSLLQQSPMKPMNHPPEIHTLL
jgi:hypothetical protein